MLLCNIKKVLQAFFLNRSISIFFVRARLPPLHEEQGELEDCCVCFWMQSLQRVQSMKWAWTLKVPPTLLSQ